MADLNANDYKFTPLSDVTISDGTLAEQHKNLIEHDQFSDATDLLDNNDFEKGYRASFFNTMATKIRNLQIYLLNKLASPEEYYSLTEPTEEQMENKIFWIQPYD